MSIVSLVIMSHRLKIIKSWISKRYNSIIYLEFFNMCSAICMCIYIYSHNESGKVRLSHQRFLVQRNYLFFPSRSGIFLQFRRQSGECMYKDVPVSKSSSNLSNKINNGLLPLGEKYFVSS